MRRCPRSSARRDPQRAVLGEGWAYAAVCEGQSVSQAPTENWQEAGFARVPEASVLQQDRAGGRHSLLHKDAASESDLVYSKCGGGFPFECRTSYTVFPRREQLHWTHARGHCV